jgi:hypothetical protein
MKRITIVCGAALLAIAGSLGYCQVRATQINAAFAKVAVGDTENDVIAKMGRPHRRVEGCGHSYSLNGRRIVGCAREYVYFPPWTIVEESWSIAFGDSGAVTHTAHFVSP